MALSAMCAQSLNYDVSVQSQAVSNPQLYEFQGLWMTKLQALTYFKQQVGAVECPSCHHCIAQFRYLNNLCRRSAPASHHLQPRFQCRHADCRKMFLLQGHIRGPYHKRTSTTAANTPPKSNVPLQLADLQHGTSYMGNLLLDQAHKLESTSGMNSSSGLLPIVDCTIGAAPHVNSVESAHCVDDDNNFVQDNELASLLDHLISDNSASTSSVSSNLMYVHHSAGLANYATATMNDHSVVHSYVGNRLLDQAQEQASGMNSDSSLLGTVDCTTDTALVDCAESAQYIDDDHHFVQDNQLASMLDQLMMDTNLDDSFGHSLDDSYKGIPLDQLMMDTNLDDSFGMSASVF